MWVTLSPSDRARARKALRAQRRTVTPEQRKRAALQVARRIANTFPLSPGKRIAVYSPFRDELDISALVAMARERRCEIYLPRLIDYRACRMRFYSADTLTPNRLGILEPERRDAIGARWLDYVFLPLVGFDAKGMRLGMGAGYYDRAFAFRRWRSTWRGPRLIGVGYAFQQLEDIAAASHDVLMDAVVTEEGVIRCRTGF